MHKKTVISKTETCWLFSSIQVNLWQSPCFYSLPLCFPFFQDACAYCWATEREAGKWLLCALPGDIILGAVARVRVCIWCKLYEVSQLMLPTVLSSAKGQRAVHMWSWFHIQYKYCTVRSRFSLDVFTLGDVHHSALLTLPNRLG